MAEEKKPVDRNAKARALLQGAKGGAAATKPTAPQTPVREAARMMAQPEGPAGATPAAAPTAQSAPTTLPDPATSAPAATAQAHSFDQVEQENARLETRLRDVQRTGEEIERRIKEGRQRNEELGQRIRDGQQRNEELDQRIKAFHRDAEETPREAAALPAPFAAPSAARIVPATPKPNPITAVRAFLGDAAENLKVWFELNKKKITMIAAGLVALVTVGTISGYTLKAHFANKARKAAVAAKLEDTKKSEAAKKAKDAAEAEKARKAGEALRKAKAEMLAKAEVIAKRIVERCRGPASQSLRQEPPSIQAKALCLTKQDAERLTATAALFGKLENYKEAGLRYLEAGEVANAKAMSAQCRTAKDTACVQELDEKAQVMGKALVMAELMQRASEPLLDKKDEPAPASQKK